VKLVNLITLLRWLEERRLSGHNEVMGHNYKTASLEAGWTRNLRLWELSALTPTLHGLHKIPTYREAVVHRRHLATRDARRSGVG